MSYPYPEYYYVIKSLLRETYQTHWHTQAIHIMYIEWQCTVAISKEEWKNSNAVQIRCQYPSERT